MAWLSDNDDFEPDLLGLPVIGIASETMNHDSGEHRHELGQLLFTQRGCISIRLQDSLCMLPPTRAAWVPPHTVHRVIIKKKTVGFRSIFLDIAQIGTLPSQTEILEVNSLLRVVLERIATASFSTTWHEGPAANLLAVCLDEIRLARRESTILRLPSDRRLANLSSDELPPPLKLLAIEVGASEKTISRIFIRETGLNYQQWRQQWRFLQSIALLAQRIKLSDIANELEFASDSAFIAFFKKMSGSTPRAYMSPPMPNESVINSYSRLPKGDKLSNR